MIHGMKNIITEKLFSCFLLELSRIQISLRRLDTCLMIAKFTSDF
jgi:hypothetical protein